MVKKEKKTKAVVKAIKPQIDKCCKVLLEYMTEEKMKQEKNEYNNNDNKQDHIFIVLGLRNKSPIKTLLSTRIDIPYSYWPKRVSICLIVKDKLSLMKYICPDLKIPEEIQKAIPKRKGKLLLSQFKGKEKGDLKILIEKEIIKRIQGIRKILTLSEVKSKYNNSEKHKEFYSMYDVFIADTTIYTELANFLGDSFFSKPKRPLPLKIARKNQTDYGKIFKKALRSAYVHLYGSDCSIRIAHDGFSEEKLIANTTATISNAIDVVPHKWSGITSIHIKGNKTAALPIYKSKESTNSNDDQNQNGQDIKKQNRNKKNNSDKRDKDSNRVINRSGNDVRYKKRAREEEDIDGSSKKQKRKGNQNKQKQVDRATGNNNLKTLTNIKNKLNKLMKNPNL